MSLLVLSQDPALISEDYDSDIQTGDRAVMVFDCINKSSADTKKFELLTSGARTVSLRNKGDGSYSVTGVWSFDPNNPGGPSVEPPQSIHELDIAITNPNIFTNLVLQKKFYQHYGNNITTAYQKLSTTAKIIDKYERGDYDKGDTAYIQARVEIRRVTGDFQVALDLFDAVAMRKQTSFISYYPVYRRTLTAAIPQQVKASFEGVGKIWTSKEIEDYDGLPDDWWFSLPADYQWLKSPPQVNTVAGQKTQISYSYTAADYWSGLTYVPYRSAVLFGGDSFPGD